MRTILFMILWMGLLSPLTTKAAENEGASDAAETVPTNPPRSSMDAMQVAAVQIDTRHDLEHNTRQILDAIAREAELGTRLVVFEECALTSYEVPVMREMKMKDINKALDRIADACREHDIYAAVGAPYRENDTWYNGAFVYDPQGKLIKRYAKLFVVRPNFFANGDKLAIFRVDDVPFTIMICHDERYPEIFRIPVLGGARVGIYMSCESKTEKKWDNYRSQIMARATENQISVIACNAGDGGELGGSHGHSRILDPRGNILAEAGTQPGVAIRAVIHPKESSQNHARRGAESPAVKTFWAEGLRLLKAHNPEYFKKEPLNAAAE